MIFGKNVVFCLPRQVNKFFCQ